MSHLHAYKIQLTQELKSLEHLQRCRLGNRVTKRGESISYKIIFSHEAHFHLNGMLITRTAVFGDW